VQSDSRHRRYDIKNPISLESIGMFEAATVTEVQAAVMRGRNAQA